VRRLPGAPIGGWVHELDGALSVDDVRESTDLSHLSWLSAASFLKHREQGVPNQSVDRAGVLAVFAGRRRERVE
jgi:hypothetical protein